MAANANKRADDGPMSPREVFESGIATMLGFGATGTATGVTVTIERALGVPAIFTAVNFLAGTMAGLPINVFMRRGEKRTRVIGGLSSILHDAPNDEMSSFEWRKAKFEAALTGGRGLSFIERTASGNPVNIWPLDPEKTTIERKNGRKVYRYRTGRRSVEYMADEVIDIPFMLHSDGLRHRGPIMTNKETIGLAIAATEYGARFFQNGGVPPFAITGNFQSAAALNAAGDDMHDAVKKAAKEQRQALTLPTGLDVKSIGVDPEKAQSIEMQRFQIEQIARIYSIPPTFLQDLTHGTFSNTEQQDLHFVKHCLRRWVEQFEQELNLKLFGRGRADRFVEMNIDGLLRGDFKTRMEGYAHGIQNAVIKPNEARRRENLPDDPEGDRLLIQGATVPVGTQPKTEGSGNGGK